MVNIISLNLLVFKVTVGIRVDLILFDKKDGLVNARRLVESVLCPCRDLLGPLSVPSRFAGRGSIGQSDGTRAAGITTVHAGTLRNIAVLL